MVESSERAVDPSHVNVSSERAGEWHRDTECQVYYEKLRHEREVFEKLLERASIGIAIVRGAELRIAFANPLYAALAGETPATAVDRKFSEVFTQIAADPTGVPLLLQAMLDVMATGVSRRLQDYRVIRGSRTEPTYWNIDLVALYNGGSTSEAVLVLTSETTQQVRSRQETEELASRVGSNLQQLEAVINTIDIGVVIVEPSGEIVKRNTTALTLLDLVTEEETGRYHLSALSSFFEMQSLAGVPIEVSELPASHALQGESVANFVVKVRNRRSGRSWIGRFNSRPVRSPASGDIMFVVVTFEDISDQMLREAALQHLNDTLEDQVARRTAEAQRRAAQLQTLAAQLTRVEERERRRLAQMLHDHLQQLLVAAQMQLGLVASRATEVQLRRDVVSTQDIVRQCIEASRSLTIELSPAVLYDAGLVAAFEWLGRNMQEKYGLKIGVDLDRDVDLPDQEVQVFLFNAVRELLFNVVKHANAAHAEVSMRQGADGTLAITVADRGCGFDPKKAQAENSSATGLGLFSLRERLSWVAGALSVESAPGAGTTVTLHIPKSTRQLSELHSGVDSGQGSHREEGTDSLQGAYVRGSDEASWVTATGRKRRSSGNTIRVVVVDDHKLVRAGLARLLEQVSDIEVVGQAADGAEAIEVARSTDPDVVTMDVTLPTLSGIEATRLLLAERPAIRVIGLSMHEDDEVARAMRDAGAVAYMTKGGPPEDLIRTIRTCAAPRARH